VYIDRSEFSTGLCSVDKSRSSTGYWCPDTPRSSTGLSSVETSICSSGPCGVDTSTGEAHATVVQKHPRAAQAPVLWSRKLQEQHRPLQCIDTSKCSTGLFIVEAKQFSFVQTSPGAGQASVAGRHVYMLQRPLWCRHVQMLKRPLQCRHFQVPLRPLWCRHIHVQLRSLLCRHLQERHLLLLSIQVQVLLICSNTFKIERKTD
jgi:hypothetical protein